MNIDRINELARKSRSVGLTEEEKIEQERLRKEYIENFRNSMRAHLENTYIVDKDGKKVQAKEYNKK